jgi:hypothetical protein
VLACVQTGFAQTLDLASSRMMGVNANVETTIYLPDTPKRVKAALVLHTSSGLKEADHIHQGFFEVPVSRTSGYAKGHDTCCDQDCAKKANPAVAFAQ